MNAKGICRRRLAALLAGAMVAALAAGCAGRTWDINPHLSRAAGYDVRILRDTWGVPHVFGRTDADAAFGLAYAHAEDDFYTIQENLLISRAKLASVRGREAAPIDYLVQSMRVHERVWEKYDADLSPETRRLVEAYADGINYFAALHPDQVRANLFPVEGRDVVAGFVAIAPVFYGLDGAIEKLFGDEAPQHADRTNGAGGWLAAAGGLGGSNAFAVSPARSSEGQTMLCLNSHQPWDGNAAWYEAHVHSDEGWDMVGGLFPGAPVVLAGHNRDLGWAPTVNLPHLYDIYALELDPKDKNRYLLDGGSRPFERGEAKLQVRLPGGLKVTVRRETLWSVHGPAFRTKRGVYAIRYAGLDDIRLVEQWFRMNKARNFAEWQAAMRMLAIPSFNFVYADKQGNIYYLYNGRFPVRAPGGDPAGYLPGNVAKTVWKDIYPLDALPQVFNPPSGMVQSCNSSPFQTTVGAGNPRPSDFAPEMGVETRMTNRSLRARALYGGDNSITWEKFQAYKFDENYERSSSLGEFVQGILAAPAPADPLLREAVEAVRQFDFRADPASRSLPLIALSAAPFIYHRRLLGRPTATPLESLAETAREFKRQFGRIDPAWGEIARLTRGKVDLPLSGGPDTLRAVAGIAFRNGRLADMVGDSYILFVKWDKDGRVTSRAIHQYGAATRDAASPHFADQAPLFADKQTRPVWLDEADIRAHLEREYRPGEELPKRR